jgi:heat shock protein HslJ
MRIRVTVIALAVLAGALVSCGPKTSTSEPAAGNALPRTEGAVARAPAALSSPSLWLLREIAGNPVPAPAAGAKAPSLAFDREGNRVLGFAGCNSFSGSCEYPGEGRLRFSMMAATRMACPDMTVEDEFLRALGTADSYSTDGKVLKLLRAKLAPLAVFEASGAKGE